MLDNREAVLCRLPQIPMMHRAGKLFGLHSGNGHPLWALKLPVEHKPQQILPWRTMHDVQHAPEIVALHTHGSASGFTVINAHTGDVVSSHEFDSSVDQVRLPEPAALRQKASAVLPGGCCLDITEGC